MDLLKSYYDKKTRDYQLVIQRNSDTGEIVLSYAHKSGRYKTLIKIFKNEFDYSRWLDEAVALRAAADDKSVKNARSIWRKMVDFMEDKISGKTFLLWGFLLMSISGITGCSTLDTLDKLSDNNLRCSYQREAFLKCVLNDESEVLNEKIQ